MIQRVSYNNETDRSFRVGFLIAGVQKAGTSSLYQMLRRHPAVGFSSVKEVHFFDDEDRVDWTQPRYNRFHSYFPRRRHVVAYGEATPIYVYWPKALERIKAYWPDMKLILLFRDPIGRTYSAWCHQRRKGREPLSFSQAIREGRARISSRPDYAMRHFSYVERSFYGEQLGRCLALFPASNVLCLDCAQLSLDPSGIMDRVASFLGIESPSRVMQAVRANSRPQDQLEEKPLAEDVQLLVDEFAPDLDRFARLIDFPIDNWPTARIMRGEISPQDLARQLARPESALSKQGRRLREPYPLVTSATIWAKRAAAAVRRYARPS